MSTKNGAEIDEAIKGVGLGEKGARVYRAALELGESSVQEVARRAALKRTTVYYILEELKEVGTLQEVRRGKREYIVAVEPREVLRRARERVDAFANVLPEIESLKLAKYKKPGVYFLHGPSGFKQVWDRVFQSKEDEYYIITSAEHFLDFVTEKYIVSEIIKGKRLRNFKSRQLITDSPYARKVVAKDMSENRTSKFLSPRHTLPYTEVVGDVFCILISPRPDNLILVIENDALAKTRRSYFELLWNALP